MRRNLSKYFIVLSIFSVLAGTSLLVMFGHRSQPDSLKTAYVLFSKNLSERQDFTGKLNLTSMTRFFKDPKLVDPRNGLPHSHLLDRSSLAQIYTYAQTCRGFAIIKELGLGESLSKLRDFHSWKCGDIRSLPERFLQVQPFMHPAGVSYAFLLWNSESKLYKGTEYLQNFASYFHINDLVKLAEPPRIENQYLREFIKLESFVRSAILSGKSIVYSHREQKLFFQKPRDKPSSRVVVVYSKAVLEKIAADIGVSIIDPSSTGNCKLQDSFLCISKKDGSSRQKRIVGYGFIVFGFLILLLLGAALSFYRLRQLRRDQELKKLIYRTFVHEFRTPITALKLDIENLRPSFDDFNQAVQDSFLRICDGVGRLERLVAASVAYINDKGGKAYGDNHFNVSSLLGSSEYFVHVEGGFSIDESLLNVFGDSGIIHMLVGIIIDNAKQHGADPLRLSLRYSDDWVWIDVQDGGEWVVSKSKKQPGSGMGIGLALVKNWIERMGGAVEYSADPTTVSLKLIRSR